MKKTVIFRRTISEALREKLNKGLNNLSKRTTGEDFKQVHRGLVD